MSKLPFSVFRRKGRKFYYVKFKDSEGNYLPAVSTQQEEEGAAIEAAFSLMKGDCPGQKKLSIREFVRGVESSEDAKVICNELKRLGYIKSFVLSSAPEAVDLGKFLVSFWDYDTSPYVKEKLRRKHGIHRNHTVGQKLSAENIWAPFFKGKLLGEITLKDIDSFMDELDSFSQKGKLSSGRKNNILRAGTVPLRWAFSKGMIDKDVTSGIVWFSGARASRNILTPEIAQAVFSAPWLDERAKLANVLAAITGLRAGEILGLRSRDLGKDCLYVEHSWNRRDGLKTPKNNEPRTVEVPFPQIISDLILLSKENPHGVSMDSFVFWAEKLSTKPMESKLFILGLRDALVKVGLTKKEVEEFSFHGWRHFFTTYMVSRLEKKLLKSQTGHLSDSMIDLYGGHLAEGDREKIRSAQVEVFGKLVPVNN